MNNKYRSKEHMINEKFKKLLLDEDINRHPNYNFTESVFTGQGFPITFRCDLHNKEITLHKAAYLKSIKNRCDECESEFTEFYQIEKFIAKANRKHNSKFDYSKVKDYSSTKVLTITCPIHGDFKQVAQDHLRSTCGCHACGEEYAKAEGAKATEGWTREGYINRIKGDTSNVYVIQIEGNGELFYKIGITCNSVWYRFRGKKHLPKEYTITIKHLFNNLDAGVAFDFEKALHEKNHLNRYEPLIKFAGHTECYKKVPKYIEPYLGILETLS